MPTSAPCGVYRAICKADAPTAIPTSSPPTVVADSLAPAGRVFFVDDNARTPEELIEGESSTTIVRQLNDGTSFRLVKVPYTPADLETRLGRLGWRITVTQASGPFFWGAG